MLILIFQEILLSFGEDGIYHCRHGLETIYISHWEEAKRQYEKLFELDGIKLTFTPGGLDFIVDKALEYNLGARGLRSLCEAILTDAMFEMPGGNETQLKVTKNYAEGKLNNSKDPALKVVS